MYVSPQFRIIYLGIYLTLLPGLSFAAIQDLPLKIEPNRVHTGDLFDFNQEIFIQGELDGDLNVINCQVHVEGVIKGNVSMLGGMLTAELGARIEGNVVIFGGRFEAPADTVQGKVVHYFDPNPRPNELDYETFASQAAVFFAQTLFLFVLAVVIFYFFPNQVHEASFQLSQDLVRPVIIGVISLAACFFGLLASFLLIVIGIGFPLFLLFLTGLIVVLTFGVAVVFYRLGQILEQWSQGIISTVFGILLAVLFTSLAMHIPVIGAFVLFALGLFGTGIVIETRFGTNKQWFTRRSRYWSAG